MLLTRRFFLLGTASAVAAATIPLQVLAPVTPVVSPVAYTRRLITEINCFPGEGLSDHPIVFEIRRPNSDFVLWRNAISPRGVLYWSIHGNPEFAIVVPKDQTLIFDVQHPDITKGPIAEIKLICNDKYEDGSTRTNVETHRFPTMGPPRLERLDA